jgi:putative peptidoglycan lipid II flippase
VRSHALLVGAGIALSRVVGLVRQRVFSHYFGIDTVAAGAFSAAFRIPNLLQNLFGEGVLSASFIPVYSRLLAEKNEREAARVAGAVGALLAVVVSAIALVGVLATPLFIDLIADGFEGHARELTIRLARILFAGAGVLALSAWCLGILNSHRMFFLSYAAPVVWSAAMITAMVWSGGRLDTDALAVRVAWASVAGSALMFLVQLPAVLRYAGRLSLGRSPHVAEVARNFGPAFVSRGVVQISAYIDVWIASYLGTVAVAALTNAQTLYTLPVSLFGMSVSAAELPELSSVAHERLMGRVNAGLRKIAYFVVPSAVAFLALGDVITAALFQTGRFGADDTRYVWAILAGSAVSLLPQTLGRLYSSTYYALRDTRTPLRFAVVRVALSAAMGYTAARPLGWGAPGLTLASGIAGWVEFALLRHSLNRRIGSTGLPWSYSARVWGAAIAAAGAGWAVKLAVGLDAPNLDAGAILGAFGVVYLGLTYLLGVAQPLRS